MECASGWGKVKNFIKNVLLTGEILKKLKMLKMGGNHVCAQGIDTQNMVPPIFNIFNFFRISQARSTFLKKLLTFPQPEAHTLQKTLPLGKC